MAAATTVTQKLARPRAREGTEVAARVGLATQGVLYLVVAVLAIRVAQTGGTGGEAADQHGALDEISQQPVGRALVGILAVGCALHATWRIVRAVRGDKAASRIADAGRAVVYIGLTLVAGRLFFDTGSAGGGGQREQKATAKVLDWPGGTAVVVIVGLLVLAGAAWQWRQPITRKFMKKLRPGYSESFKRAVAVVGSIGYIGRGLAFGLVGWFLLFAARRNDPGQARGLDGALRDLAGDYPWLPALVAVGLFAFGLFRLVDASLRREAET